ncbi:hypothetical protein O0I10_005278 [Lichtheimia ornata]|uniref:Uncharacterized protein n=1 Tax=Lichtheimia ornata TaxID=688661 RepID=A0AAD7XZN7_9FUNG|nr:uncharacterized protein O0I10_005278 [Lichtheimia ornata]KAJ8658896.1 hypothetical protein O0I10_005278 [Lichtheimia ornata]
MVLGITRVEEVCSSIRPQWLSFGGKEKPIAMATKVNVCWYDFEVDYTEYGPICKRNLDLGTMQEASCSTIPKTPYARLMKCSVKWDGTRNTMASKNIT